MGFVAGETEVIRGSEGLSLDSPARDRWDLGFVGILFLLIVEYTRLGAVYPVLGQFHVGKIAVAATVVGWLVYRFAGGMRPGINRIDVALLLFFITTFLSACFSPFQDSAWGGFVYAAQWGVTYLLITRTVTNSWRLRIFIFLLLLLNLKLAQFAIRSYIGALAAGRSEIFLASHGAGAGSTGFFGNSGDLGVALCVILPIAGYLMFGEKKKSLRLLLLIFFLAFLGAIFFTGSRGAVLGAGATGLAACVLSSKMRLAGASMVILVGLGSVFFLPDANKDRMRSALDWENDPTVGYRVDLWKLGLRMFRDHPITGVGPMSFTTASLTYPQARRIGFEGVVQVPHSIYIEALSQLGLLGVIALLMLWLFFFRLNSQTRKRLLDLGSRPRAFEFSLAFGLDLAMVGYMVSGAFLTVLYYPHLWILLALSVCLHTSVSQKTKGLAPTAVAEMDAQVYSLPVSG